MKLLIGPGLSALALALGAAALAGQAQVAAPPAPPPLTQPDALARAVLPATQGLFQDYVRRGRASGIVAAIGVGPRAPVFPAAGRIGDAATSLEAGPDSLWRIYSMTKPVTAMAAMILVDEGKLSLDQPIATVFPGFAKMRVLTSPDTSLDSRPATVPITVRHLLTHTAGLGYSIVTKGPLQKEYERLGILPLTVSAAAEPAMRRVRPATLQAFAERVATLPLVAEPGTRWSYSIGLDVLAAVVERVAEMPFERFVQTRLFDPLGMRSTYWQVPAAEAGRLADNDTWLGETRAPLDPGRTSVFLQRPSFPYGGAGLVSTARDYDRFLQMLLNGGELDGRRVMRAETVRLAMSNLLPVGVVFPGAGEAGGFGAGGFVRLTDEPGGASKGTYGWSGAAGTFAWVDPVRRVRGTVMVNYFPADQWPLKRDVAAALLRDAARMRR